MPGRGQGPPGLLSGGCFKSHGSSWCRSAWVLKEGCERQNWPQAIPATFYQRKGLQTELSVSDRLHEIKQTKWTHLQPMISGMVHKPSHWNGLCDSVYPPPSARWEFCLSHGPPLRVFASGSPVSPCRLGLSLSDCPTPEGKQKEKLVSGAQRTNKRYRRKAGKERKSTGEATLPQPRGRDLSAGMRLRSQAWSANGK